MKPVVYNYSQYVICGVYIPCHHLQETKLVASDQRNSMYSGHLCQEHSGSLLPLVYNRFHFQASGLCPLCSGVEGSISQPQVTDIMPLMYLYLYFWECPASAQGSVVNVVSIGTILSVCVKRGLDSLGHTFYPQVVV